MDRIDNDGICDGLIFGDGDLGIVFESPNEDNNLFNSRIERWLKNTNILPRLASMHIINPYPRISKKKVSLRNLRLGWARVASEIESMSPTVARILVFSSSDLLNKVLVPELDSAMDTAHGTIFDIKLINRIIECVPTFDSREITLKNKWQPNEVKYAIPNHMKQWFNTDVDRFVNLKKRNPLSYISGLSTEMFQRRSSYAPWIGYKHIICDLETTGLDAYKDQITTIGVQWTDSKRILITGPEIPLAIENLKEALRSGSHITFHNAQFDLGFFDDEFRQLIIDQNHCTLIRAKATGELAAPLKHLINVYTNSPGGYSHIVPGQEFKFDDPAYVCEDIDGTWKLNDHYEYASSLPVVQLFENCVIMAADQTSKGSMIDVTVLNKIEQEGKELVSRLETDLTEKYGVHPGSNDSLIPVLQSRGYKLTKKTDKGKLALDEEVLKNLDLMDILDYRKAVKLDSSFVGKIKSLMRDNGTLPHNQNMLNADTGRSTMSNFNWQQASREGPVKCLLISRFAGGFIGNVDLQGAELCVGAYVSNDVKFAKAQQLADMHRVHAAKAFDIMEAEVRKAVERYAAKTMTFKSVYGGFPNTPEEKRVYDFLKAEYPSFFGWLNQTGEQAMIDNKVTDFYGKTNNLLDILDYRGKWGVKRAGLNSPIQGLSSHIAFEITFYIWRSLINMRSLCLFGVHDSVVLDIHPDELDQVIQIVKDAFKNLWNTPVAKFKIFRDILPMRGDLLIGRSWGAVEESNKAYDLYMPVIKCNSHEGRV